MADGFGHIHGSQHGFGGEDGYNLSFQPFQVKNGCTRTLVSGSQMGGADAIVAAVKPWVDRSGCWRCRPAMLR
jgi:hypothetical protein